MKIVAGLMILIGLVLGAGAVLEFQHVGPEATPFWVAVFVTPASAFFVLAGVLLWFYGQRVRSIVVLAAVVMGAATVAATMLHVMGPPAMLIGMIGVIAVLVWFWRTRTAAPA
jgi:hypothetical protein